MRRYKTALALILVLGLCGFATAKKLDYLDGVLLIRFYEDVNPTLNSSGILTVGNPELDHLFIRFKASNFEPFFGDYIIKDPDFSYKTRNDYRIFFPDDTPMYLVAAEFEQVKGVEWAMPDVLLPTMYIPNDPAFQSQWFHNMIQSARAWDQQTGEEEILVSAIDGGIDWLHEDLYDNIWVNPGEDIDGDPSVNDPVFPDMPGTLGDWNYIDDDENGITDDFIGYDWVTARGNQMYPGEDGNPPDNNPMDFGGHGTGCNAAMAQVGDNGIDGLGVAFNCKIMCLRAGFQPPDEIGVVQSSAAEIALTYATEMGAKVISLSYGGDTQYVPMREAVEFAWENGMLIFGAAGNDDVDDLQYPANYPHVISVAATTQQDTRADFSNWGNWVDIAAPGVNCHTAWFFSQTPTAHNRYNNWDGTSVSCPIAAGIGALIIAQFPEEDNVFWNDVILNTTDPIEADHPIGSGRVNAYKALTQYYWPEITIDSITLNDPDGNGHPDLGETIEVTVEITNHEGWQNAEFVFADLMFSDPGIQLVQGTVLMAGVLPDGQTVSNTDSPLIFSVPRNFPTGQFVDLTVTISCDPNEYEVADSRRILIGTPQIILVDDDGGVAYEQYLISDLNQLGYVYNHHDVNVLGSPSLAQLRQYHIVIWMTGDVENPLSQAEIAALSGAMDTGTNLLIFGQTLDEQLAGTDFYADYLHCEQSAGNRSMGLQPAPDAPQPPVIPGCFFVLMGDGGAGNNIDADIIAPLNGGQAAYNYAPTANAGAVLYDGEDYKTFYFALAFEAVSGMNNTTTRRVLLGGNDDDIEGILDWFGVGEPPPPPDELTITLQGRYFELISTYLVPPVLNAAIVFGDVAALEIVYQSNGGIYIPPHINTIGNINVTQGYQIFCWEASQLVISGEMIDPATEYNLNPNIWNWLGYPFDTPTPITVALGDIAGEIQIVQTDDGRLWIPPIINTIGNMQGGEGYFVFIDSHQTFTFNPGILRSSNDKSEILELPPVEGAPQPTGRPYAVLAQLSEALQAINPAAIALYDGDLLVGKSAVIDYDLIPVIAWQGAPEFGIPGFDSGRPIQVKVIAADGSVLPTRMSGETAVYGAAPYAKIFLDLASSTLPQEFTVGAAYPNPFNPSVQIPLALPEAGNVTFVIFNVMGQEVYRQIHFFQAGKQEFIFDSSRLEQEFGTGLYLLQVSYQGENRNQKIVLLK